MTNAPMSRRYLKSVALAATLVALTAAGRAEAACLENILRTPAEAKLSKPINTMTPAAHVAPALYRMAARNVAVTPVSDDQGDNQGVNEPIVGLWEFRMTGNAPPDFGTQAWHSDGTELMFSAGRNPATGDVCQGAWKKIGPRTYSLNHIAMGWDFGTCCIRAHIHATVQVARSGDTYTGSFTVDVFAVSPNDPFDESVKVASGSGSMSGRRVKPDSPQ